MKLKTISLLVNGGIDTKTNPKLVQPPALLELENQYQLRTGELRTRNGCSNMGPFSTYNVQNGENLFVTQAGGVGTISRNYKSGQSPWPVALKVGNLLDATAPGWSSGSEVSTATTAYPWVTASVQGVKSQQTTFGTNTLSVPLAPDLAASNVNIRVASYVDSLFFTAFQDSAELGTLRPELAAFSLGSVTLNVGAVLRVAATGTGSHIVFFGQTGANAMSWYRYDASGTLLGSSVLVSDLAGNGFFDVKAIPGTAKMTLAYAVNGGGIKCALLDPAAATATQVVTTAAGDATLCMGFLDDQLATGSMLLATAGTTSGIVVRTMSAATNVVSATNVIDATATASVRNVTGHTTTNVSNYVVLWDIAGSSSIYDKIRIGTWNGAATIRDHYGNHSLYSRSFQMSDGRYYALGCFSSTVQGMYTLVSVDGQVTATSLVGGTPSCVVLSGEGGARRSQGSLASAVSYSGTISVPVTRKRKIATPSGSTSQGAVVSIVTFKASTKLTRARELGGTVFLPGGVMHRDDGGEIGAAVFPIYPEVCAGVSSNAGGAMTPSGTYLYRQVFKMVDAAGRVTRSAASVPFTITLGAADNTVTLTAFNLRARPGQLRAFAGLSGGGTIYSEFYRRGPVAAGATLYNKVADYAMTTANTTGTDTIAISDAMSDANAALGEVAYFNGNVLENFAPPSCSLLEVNGNRVGIVNAEDPTEFWFSKEYKAGTGIGFYPDFKVRLTGDGAGALTALAAMDGRWILFKRSAIYVLSGSGPNDLGQGSFNDPQAVSRNLGTTNPSSIIETPDGIMFQSTSGGIWLLDRGLGLSYIGGPVEQYTLAESVAGAAPATSIPTIRFVLPSGRCLEWDYHHKRWYTHQLRVDRSGSASTVVDCVNSSISGWCYLLANGDLMVEVASQTTDVNGTTTGIIPKTGFPVLQFAGLAGYQRFKALRLTVDAIGACTLSMDGEFNYSGALTGTPKTIALVAGTTAQVEYNPPEGKAKCTAARMVMTVTGNPTGGTYRVTGATLEVGIKEGTNVPAASRMT